MVEKKYIIIAVLVIAAVITYFVLQESEEEKVRKQFSLLSEYVSKKSDENNIMLAANAKKVQNLFAEHCELGIPMYSISGNYKPNDISSLVLSSRSYFAKVTLSFHDINVDFPEKDSASVNLTANLKGKLTSGEYTDDTHELEFTLEKVEDEWLINAIEAVEVLDK